MVDPRRESHLGRFERIVGREMNCKEENSALVGTVRWTHDRRLPVKHVISDWSRAALRWRITTQVLKFFCDALQGHFVDFVPCVLLSPHNRPT